MSGRWGVGRSGIRRSGVRGRGFAAVAVGLLLVAGCSDDDSPVTPTLEPTTSASAEPSPSVDVRVAPTRPAEWDQVSVQGAKAVATYFMDLYPYAFMTGDLTEWDALSDPECIFCESVRGNVTKAIAAGERFEGGDVDVSSAAGAEVTRSKMYSVDVTLTRASSRKVSASGREIAPWSEPEEVDANVLVRRDGDRWTIYNVDVRAAP